MPTEPGTSTKWLITLVHYPDGVAVNPSRGRSPFYYATIEIDRHPSVYMAELLGLSNEWSLSQLIFAIEVPEGMERDHLTKNPPQSFVKLPKGAYEFLLKIANENCPHGLAMCSGDEPDEYAVADLKQGGLVIASGLSRRAAEVLVEIVEGH